MSRNEAGSLRSGPGKYHDGPKSLIKSSRCLYLSTINKFSALDAYQNRRNEKKKIIKVKTLSLNDLLLKYDTPKSFDYLSIDTEGSEYEILNAFNFKKYNPTVITVEHNYNYKNTYQIKKLLSKNNYFQDFEIFSQQDLWFYNKSL